MTEPKSQKPAPAPSTPWQVPVTVDDVAPTGQHFNLVADAGTRAAVARVAGLRDLPRFEAIFDVTRHGADGLHVSGLISATVGQNCVVTLEPLSNELEEAVDLLFLPRQAPTPLEEDEEPAPKEPKWDDPEPLIGGSIDLGVLATEFLMLGLDPYPRKPGAVFEPPRQEASDGGPFAALAKLGKDSNGRDGS
jgi:hypothetical protein